MMLIYKLRKYTITTQYLQEVWNRRRVVYYAILLIIISGELLRKINYIIVRFQNMTHLQYNFTENLNWILWSIKISSIDIGSRLKCHDLAKQLSYYLYFFSFLFFWTYYIRECVRKYHMTKVTSYKSYQKSDIT